MTLMVTLNPGFFSEKSVFEAGEELHPPQLLFDGVQALLL